MADNDDDLEIVISPAEREEMGLPAADGDKPKITVEIEGEEPAKADKPADKADPNEEAFATLKRQREEAETAARTERQAREKAEQRAQSLEGQASEAVVQKINADHQTVLAAIDKVNSDAARAEDEYAQALEQGDYRLAAKKQRELSQAETRLDKLGDLKTRIEAAQKNPPRPQVREGRVQAPAAPADPVEAQLTSGAYSRESAAWLRQRPHLITDRTANAKMLAVHFQAVADGLKPDTQDYFAFLEQKLDSAAPAATTRTTEADPAAPAPRAAPQLRMHAPPSRQGAVATNNGKPISVRLTQDEKRFCDETGESYEEYAANKYALIQEGKLAS